MDHSKDRRRDANDFVEVMREIIRQEISERDSTAVAIIESVNSDETLNLYVLPDRQNVIRNIINQCRYDFKPGETALLYLIGNRLSNSFVIAKYNAKPGDAGWDQIAATQRIIQNFTTIINEGEGGDTPTGLARIAYTGSINDLDTDTDIIMNGGDAEN